MTFLAGSPENQSEASVAAMAYLSLREEGKTQVTIAMVEARLALFARLSAVLPNLMAGAHYEIAALTEYSETEHGNPVEQGHEIVELRVGSQLRLGVKYKAPRVERMRALDADLVPVRMAISVTTDMPTDWDVLARYTKEASAASTDLAKFRVEEAVAPSEAATGDDDDETPGGGAERGGHSGCATASMTQSGEPRLVAWAPRSSTLAGGWAPAFRGASRS